MAAATSVSEFICVYVLLCPHSKLQAVLLLLRDFLVSNAPPSLSLEASLLPSPPWGQQQFYCHPVNTAAPPPSSYTLFQHTSSEGCSPYTPASMLLCVV